MPGNEGHNEPSFDLLGFLRSLQADPWPADLASEDEAAVLERLRSLPQASDDAWVATSAIRDGASAAARAWSRADQALDLLATIDGEA